MDLDAEYDNRRRVPTYPEYLAEWEKEAKAFRAAGGGEFDLAYGAHPRQRCDIFRSKDDYGGPMVMFIHGGYWRSLDRSVFSHLARGLEFHGIPVAMPSYRLCPEVRIADVIEDARACARWLRARCGRPLVVAGHSAGGHLAACLAATDWEGLAAERLVVAGLGISGIYDLRPLIPTYLNPDLRLDEPQARLASPLTWPVPRDMPFEAWVGGEESGEFLRQSRTLAVTWTGGGANARYVEAPGANHFSVIGPLSQPDSALTLALAALCGAE
jgi:arylformamidase